MKITSVFLLISAFVQLQLVHRHKAPNLSLIIIITTARTTLASKFGFEIICPNVLKSSNQQWNYEICKELEYITARDLKYTVDKFSKRFQLLKNLLNERDITAKQYGWEHYKAKFNWLSKDWDGDTFKMLTTATTRTTAATTITTTTTPIETNTPTEISSTLATSTTITTSTTVTTATKKPNRVKDFFKMIGSKIGDWTNNFFGKYKLFGNY